MKIIRRAKFISETEHKFSFAIKMPLVRFYCAGCDAPGEMLSINEAVRQLKIRWREVITLIENGEFHATETEKGEIYICTALNKAQ